MRILQIIPTLDIGGAENFVVELSIAIKKLGYICDVLTLYDVPSDNFLKKRLISNDISVYSLGKRPGFDIRIYKLLNKFLSRYKYNVVHTHVAAVKYIVHAAIFNRKIKYFVTIHSEARREAGTSIDKWSRQILFKYKLCCPVTISSESKKSFEDFYGFTTHLIPNGVSQYSPNHLDSIRDNDEQIVFVHVASCQPIKNQKLLFEAFRKLTETGVNVKLLWLGNIHNKNLFESLSQYFSSNIHHLGVVSNVRDYLANADAMCLSSKMEGMPMSIIEAFSVGCIPICTPVGGCKNMIQDGINGFLSKDLEIESYYLKLKQFCSLSKEERTDIKNNALNSFDKYSIEECAKKYIELYLSRNPQQG